MLTDMVCDTCISQGRQGRSQHRQVHSDKLGFCADEGMIELLELLCRFGPTLFSCQNNSGLAYVNFENFASVIQLISELANVAQKSDVTPQVLELCQRAVVFTCSTANARFSGQWLVEMDPASDLVKYGNRLSPPESLLSADLTLANLPRGTVRFPQRDIPTLIQALS